MSERTTPQRKYVGGRANELFATYGRNFIFGVEDSLVSTVGLLSGVAIAGVARETIILTGVVLIFVEAFSMGIGSFLSEQSVQEFRRSRHPARHSLAGGLIMLVSYFLAGFIPLLPYLAVAGEQAFEISILATLAALFILGVVSAKIFKIKVWRNGWRMLIVGGLAVTIGILASTLV